MARRRATPEAVLRGLSETLLEDHNVQVVVAASQEPQELPSVERLTLHETLAEQFRLVAYAAIPNLDDIVLKPYDPGYKPESHEIQYLENPADDEYIAGILEAISAPADLPLFEERDDVINNLKFYSIVLGAHADATFFRTYTSRKELSRSRTFAAIFRNGAYDRLTERTFLFDDRIECFFSGDYMFVLSPSGFQRLFNYFEAVREQANEALDTVIERVPVSNAEDFRRACISNVQMAAKLSQIISKPYFARVQMRDVKRTIREFELPVEVVRQNGQEQLVFDNRPATRWIILKLLDDAYLGSVLTRQHYEVNSKTPL